MKIVVLDGHTENPGDLSWAGFEQLGELTVYPRTAPEQAVQRIGDAQAVIVNKTPITCAILEACPSIRYIGVLATGYNVIDVAACRERGIPVCNIPAYGTAAVAQYVFALLLEICHRVQHHSDSVYAGQWAACPDFCYWNHPLIELSGKTMGIIGFGRIGQATAAIAKAFGMEVLAYGGSSTSSGCGLAEFVELDALLARSDVLSLHCPLSPDTQHIISRHAIAQMKHGAILINTSRGPLVDEQALAEALSSGKLYAAAVDVVSSEPIQHDNPLLTAKNCLITPHIAWAPKESRQRLMEMAVKNLEGFVQGRVVNCVYSITD